MSGYGLKSVDWLSPMLIVDTQLCMNRRSFFPKMQYAISMALHIVLNICTCKDYYCNIELIQGRLRYGTVQVLY